MYSNQLKLNANSVVDGLNLVNVIQRPQPIVIHNLSGGGRNYSPPTRDFTGRQSDFEVIDEDKMQMYSYLVRREMKTKEWLSRFSLTHPDKLPGPHGLEADAVTATRKPANGGFVRPIITRQPVSSRTSQSPSSSRRVLVNSKKSSSSNDELDELRTCCEETLKAIEYLEKKLSECKSTKIFYFVFFYQ